jgi:hypothetical protein
MTEFRRTDQLQRMPRISDNMRTVQRVETVGEVREQSEAEALAELHRQSEAEASVERHYRLARATQVVWLVTGILESLIGIRILLKLIAANPEAGFATFIYNLTAVFLAPFFGLTAEPEANGAVLEISSLIAMLAYALLTWAIVRVMHIAFQDRSEV